MTTKVNRRSFLSRIAALFGLGSLLPMFGRAEARPIVSNVMVSVGIPLMATDKPMEFRMPPGRDNCPCYLDDRLIGHVTNFHPTGKYVSGDLVLRDPGDLERIMRRETILFENI